MGVGVVEVTPEVPCCEGDAVAAASGVVVDEGMVAVCGMLGEMEGLWRETHGTRGKTIRICKNARYLGQGLGEFCGRY
jgi:hypothetical protein